MRKLRSGVALTAMGLGAALIAGSALPAQQEERQQEDLYPATLQFGTGLVDIPVAWVSPNSSDIWIQASAKEIPFNLATQRDLPFMSRWNGNFAIDTHWRGRFSVGFSLYSQNPDYGFFGQALLLKQKEASPWPAIAVGFRNLGPYTHEDRLLVGHDIRINSNGGTDPITPSYAKGFSTSPTLYGVATKSFIMGRNSASLTVGYGNGLFSDDGDLGRNYNDKGQIAPGLFLGGRYAMHPSSNTRIDFLADNNGWDWNAGVVGTWRGISLGVYGTELEEGGKSTSKGALYTAYNYTKINVTFGYSGNLHEIAAGTVLRSRVGELQREEDQLRSELAQRERRIQSLELALRKSQAGELAEVAKRREQLQSQIQDERDAIDRAEQRLKALQQGEPPKPPPSGGSKPPTP